VQVGCGVVRRRLSRSALAAVLGILAVACAVAATSGGGWRDGARLPQARSEVAGAVFQGRIAVAGGFLQDGTSSPRVDLYDPVADRWTRLPDLPLGVNHAMAAGGGGRLYVLGGYADREPQRFVVAWNGRRWLRLPPLPEPRAAGGAAFAGGRLYVVGGVGEGRRLAEDAFVYDPATRRWSRIPGPTPREHLGVTALAGRVFAAGGRTAGFDTNLDVFEVYRPARRRWVTLPDVPTPRGGTGLAAVGGVLVSAGGEETAGTIESVFRYDRATRRWTPLADMPTPRHGLALVGVRERVYAIGGGPEPGLTVSRANESLAVG
jgi:non-specific serine/threonine protein kinase